MARTLLSLASESHALEHQGGPVASGLGAVVENRATDLVPAAVTRVLENGHDVGGEHPFREVLNQTLCQQDPRQRVMSVADSSFNPAVAVARLVWHLAGRSELAAIAFYEPRARLFSDDDQVLPGSNTGARLLGTTDGVDQIAGLISRLRADAYTRRAAATVWRPEDAVRDSRDIPCTAGLTCHIRGGQLVTTVSMRSNNVLRLLPYNLFEFTMLAEIIAVEVGVEPGPYWHTVNSLHVFEADLEAASAIARASRGDSEAMAPMPGPGAIEEAACLAEHEARLRAAFEAGARDPLETLMGQAERDLHPYWFGLYAVLAVFCTRRAKAQEAVDFERLVAAAPAPLRANLLP